MRRLRLAAASACILLLSCSVPTEGCSCPAARTHAVVYGAVTSADGAPVPGAKVSAALFQSVCGEGHAETDADASPAMTGAAGGYRLHFYSTHGPHAGCVRVAARAGAAGDSAVVHAAVQMRNDRETPDSVRVDLVLP